MNAQQVATQTAPGPIFATHNVHIGHGDSYINRYFDGLIDEAQIFNRALTATEIQAIFNAGAAGQRKPGGP